MRFFLYILIAFFLFSCSSGGDAEHTPTWVKDVAPILAAHCVECHRDGGGAPFVLSNYEAVLSHKKMVRHVITNNYMPPYPADKNYRHFINEKGLSVSEIELIKKWISIGAPYGDSTIKDSIINEADYSFSLGKPDLVLSMSDSFLIEGNNTDKFVMMKIPFELPQKRYVKMIEFVPGNPQLVHHVNAHLISYDEEKKKNIFEGVEVLDYYKLDNNLERFKALGLQQDDGTFPTLTENICNYLPSVKPHLYPQGIGGYEFPKKGALLLNDMHYGPTPKDAKDKSYFNIYFMDEPPKRPLQEFYLGTYGVAPIEPPLVIPPDTVMTFKTQYRLKDDISILTINPHMHLIGKSFWAYAISPLGDTIPIIKIPEWNFRWQYYYTFPKILVLKKGTLIYVEGIYDNTSKNPNNPFNPPQTISEKEGSMKTTDEMFQLIIMYLPYQNGDENISLQ